MKMTFTPIERAEILRLAQDANEIRSQYWDALSALENALSFEVDGLDNILESCPNENCTEEEFDTFIQTCLEASELTEEDEEELC